MVEIKNKIIKVEHCKKTNKWQAFITKRGSIVFDSEIEFLDHFGEDSWEVKNKEKVSDNKTETIYQYIFSRLKQ